jgi:uncharacterized protein YsxB (DUF464 family)
MVSIEAALDRQGILRSCSVKGHAGSGPMGHDIVCAAVTILVRTAVTVLSAAAGVVLRVDAPRRGELYFEADYDDAGAAFLKSTGIFIMEGFKSVAAEYPVNCSLRMRNFN